MQVKKLQGAAAVLDGTDSLLVRRQKRLWECPL